MNKPSWQVTAELKLQRIEAQASAAREAAQAIYHGELVPTQQAANRINERVKQLQAWRPASQATASSDPTKAVADVEAELASLAAEQASVNAALADIKERRTAALAAASVANQHAERAKKAYRQAVGTTTSFNARDGFTASAGTVSGV